MATKPKLVQASLQVFEALREVRLHCHLFTMLWGQKQDYENSDAGFQERKSSLPLIVEELPLSIEHVHFDGRVSMQEINALVLGLFERRAESLPNMKMIAFDHVMFYDVDVEEPKKSEQAVKLESSRVIAQEPEEACMAMGIHSKLCFWSERRYSHRPMSSDCWKKASKLTDGFVKEKKQLTPNSDHTKEERSPELTALLDMARVC